MNKQLRDFARTQIKEGLAQLPESWQDKFKLMYAEGDISLSINEVVDFMPFEKLDWAMQQVSNSLKKLREEK